MYFKKKKKEGKEVKEDSQESVEKKAEILVDALERVDSKKIRECIQGVGILLVSREHDKHFSGTPPAPSRRLTPYVSPSRLIAQPPR